MAADMQAYFAPYLVLISIIEPLQEKWFSIYARLGPQYSVLLGMLYT